MAKINYKEVASKIATNKQDVIRTIPSMRMADNICFELIKLFDANPHGGNGITVYKANKRVLLYSVHENKIFSFRYDKDSKHMAITFKKDGKEKKEASERT